MFTSDQFTATEIKELCLTAQTDVRWKQGAKFCMRKDWDGVFVPLNKTSHCDSFFQKSINNNRGAFTLVFFLKLDDDGVIIELRSQMLLRVEWLQKQEQALVVSLAAFKVMECQPFIPKNKTQMRSIKAGALMYLDYSKIKVPHIRPVGRLDVFRCTGELPGRKAILELQRMVPPTLWALKMPKPFIMHVSKELHRTLIRHEPFPQVPEQQA